MCARKCAESFFVILFPFQWPVCVRDTFYQNKSQKKKYDLVEADESVFDYYYYYHRLNRHRRTANKL